MALGTFTCVPHVIIARLRRSDVVNIWQYWVDGIAAARVKHTITTWILHSNHAYFMAQALRSWPSRLSTMTTNRSTATTTVSTLFAMQCTSLLVALRRLFAPSLTVASKHEQAEHQKYKTVYCNTRLTKVWRRYCQPVHQANVSRTWREQQVRLVRIECSQITYQQTLPGNIL